MGVNHPGTTLALPAPILVIGWLVATASGCSIHNYDVPEMAYPSLATVAEPITDDTITGAWRNEGGVPATATISTDAGVIAVDQAVWSQIHRIGDHYRYDTFMSDGRVADSKKVRLFQVGERKFLEFNYGSYDAEPWPDVAAMHFWVEERQDGLRFRAISHQWLEDRFNLSNRPLFSGKVTPEEHCNALLEAPESAFADPNGILRRRVASHPEPQLQEADSSP